MAITLKEREELYVNQYTALDTKIKQLEEELEALKHGREQIRGKLALIQELAAEAEEAKKSNKPNN